MIMDFCQSLIILIAYTDILYARTQFAIPLQKEEHDIQRYLLPKYKNEAYFPVEDTKENGHRIAPLTSSNNLLPSLNEKKKSKPNTPANIETGPTTLFLIQEIVTEPVKYSSAFIPQSSIKSDPNMFPDLQMKSQKDDEENQHFVRLSISKDVAHVQNPSPAMQANKDKSTVSIYYTEFLKNGSYYPIPIAHILPAHEHVPLPPLSGELHTGQLHISLSEEVSKLNEPLPPLPNHISTGVYHNFVPVETAPQKLYPPTLKNLPQPSIQDPLLPLQSLDTTVTLKTSLPITDSSIPADVVPSGPYPAADSVLKEVPVVHVAEPLPPLQNTAFTNLEIPQISSLHVPKGPYPANLPVGSPYPPSI